MFYHKVFSICKAFQNLLINFKTIYNYLEATRIAFQHISRDKSKKG